MMNKNLPKIIKDDSGYLRIKMTEKDTLLKDVKLEITNELGQENVAFVKCEFLADLSEIDRTPEQYEELIKSLQETLERKDKFLKDALKELDRKKNKKCKLFQ